VQPGRSCRSPRNVLFCPAAHKHLHHLPHVTFRVLVWYGMAVLSYSLVGVLFILSGLVSGCYCQPCARAIATRQLWHTLHYIISSLVINININININKRRASYGRKQGACMYLTSSVEPKDMQQDNSNFARCVYRMWETCVMVVGTAKRRKRHRLIPNKNLLFAAVAAVRCCYCCRCRSRCRGCYCCCCAFPKPLPHRHLRLVCRLDLFFNDSQLRGSSTPFSTKFTKNTCRSGGAAAAGGGAGSASWVLDAGVWATWLGAKKKLRGEARLVPKMPRHLQNRMLCVSQLLSIRIAALLRSEGNFRSVPACGSWAASWGLTLCCCWAGFCRKGSLSFAKAVSSSSL